MEKMRRIAIIYRFKTDVTCFASRIPRLWFL